MSTVPAAGRTLALTKTSMRAPIERPQQIEWTSSNQVDLKSKHSAAWYCPPFLNFLRIPYTDTRDSLCPPPPPWAPPPPWKPPPPPWNPPPPWEPPPKLDCPREEKPRTFP